MPAESTKLKALEALDNMNLIVKRGRLKHDGYSTEVVDLKLHKQGAICDGRNYCMIGTLWIAAGVKLDPYEWDELPGSGQYEREGFLKHRPGLKLAHSALNTAAERALDRLGYTWVQGEGISEFSRSERFWASASEAYFENVMERWKDEARERRAAYALIRAARRIVEAS